MNNQQKLRELLCLKLKLMRLRRKRLLLSALQKPRRIYQRNILQKRPAVGEFSTLVSDLKSEPKDFFEHFRMQRAAFDEILDLVKEKIWYPPKAHFRVARDAKAQHCQNWRVKTKHVQGSTGKDTVRKKKPVYLPRQK